MIRFRGALPIVAALGLSALATRAPADTNVALVLDGGARTMSGSPDTEKAIFDSRFGVAFGGGVFVDRGARWRFGVEGRRISRDGERAFAADRNSEAFRLGHPLEFTMTQGLASATWRFSKLGPVSPYVGAGAGIASWREESTVAGQTETATGTKALFEVRAGIEHARGRVRLGIEAGITFVPDAVGVGGISQIYDENDIGGVFVVARLGFSRK
jgi:opacity protein-like surface antigen